MDIEIAIQKGLVCVLCRSSKTRMMMCSRCLTKCGLTNSPKAETLVKAMLDYHLGGNYTESKIVLGGQICSQTVPVNPETKKAKWSTPDIVLRPSKKLVIIIIVEVDESNGHGGYPELCERNRMDLLRYGYSERDFSQLKVFIYLILKKL